jgi:hypothetical protein
MSFGIVLLSPGQMHPSRRIAAGPNAATVPPSSAHCLFLFCDNRGRHARVASFHGAKTPTAHRFAVFRRRRHSLDTALPHFGRKPDR